MKLITPALALSLAALTGQAQARDWGFSRDTVKEWDGVTYNEVVIDGVTSKYVLLDTLRIWNTGADTIWWDTAWLEVLAPENAATYFEVIAFDFGESIGGTPHLEFAPGALWENQGNKWKYPFAWVDPEKNKTLQGIRLVGNLKSEINKPSSNQISVRVIYEARDRGKDTLMVTGDYTLFNSGGVPTTLKRFFKKLSVEGTSYRIFVDAQGRHQAGPIPSTQSNPTFSIPSSPKAGE